MPNFLGGQLHLHTLNGIYREYDRGFHVTSEMINQTCGKVFNNWELCGAGKLTTRAGL
jgi:hypothetical protein